MKVHTLAFNAVPGPPVIKVTISELEVNSYDEVELVTLRVAEALAEISCKKIKKERDMKI